MGSPPHTWDMHSFVLLSLAACASARPQSADCPTCVAAEPYVHDEVAAEPYVHLEPALSQEALGVVRPRAQQAQPQQFQPQQFQPQQFQQSQQFQQPQQRFQPAQQQQFQPQQQTGFAAGPWSGQCYNNLGHGVECRRKF